MTSSVVMTLRLLTSAMIRKMFESSASLKSIEIRCPLYFRTSPPALLRKPHCWSSCREPPYAGASSFAPRASPTARATRSEPAAPGAFANDTTTVFPFLSTV